MRPILSIDTAAVTDLEIDPYRFITEAELGAVIEGKGAAKDISNISLKASVDTRLQSVVFAVAQRLFEQEYQKQTWHGREPFLFVQFLKIVQDFDSGKVRLVQDLLAPTNSAKTIVLMLAMNEVVGHISAHVGEQNAEKNRNHLGQRTPHYFHRRHAHVVDHKPVWPAHKCHLNAFAMDSGWEGSEAFALDMNPLVSSWIKNDQLRLCRLVF